MHARHRIAKLKHGVAYVAGLAVALSLAGAGRENAGAAEPEHTVELRASLRH